MRGRVDNHRGGRIVGRNEPDAMDLLTVAVDDVLAVVRAFLDRTPYPVDEADGCDVLVRDYGPPGRRRLFSTVSPDPQEEDR
jgi:hypothetical protein